MTNATFRVGPPAPVTSAAAPRGTHFRYALSEAAAMSIAIEQRASGRRVGRRCRPATRRLRKRPRCTRWASRGTLSAQAAAGGNATPFSGRVGRRALRPGSYRARLRATDAAGNRSGERRVALRVVRR